MKNICKILGIIAVVAMIGMVTGCGEKEADPDDQVIISFTGFPSKANNNYYARMQLSNEDTSNVTILANGGTEAEKIRGNTATNAMVINAGGDAGKAFGTAGSYFVNLAIYSSADITGTPVFQGNTKNKLAIVKGKNSFGLLDVQVGFGKVYDFFDFLDAPPATNFGTYSGLSFDGAVIETIVLTEKSFKVSDTSGSGSDSLTFRIDSWDIIPASSITGDAAGYTGGYIFKGKITAATSGYLPSQQTAPSAAGFSAADAKADGTGPDCWMSIYFKDGTGGAAITSIRTPFSKTSTTAGVVKNNNGNLRVYTKSN